jgi:Tfp pilus assembly protein PilF
MSKSRLESLKALLEQDPNDSFTRYAIALEYAALDQPADAIAMLEDLIQRDGSYLAAYQQLGHLYAKVGRKEDAKRIYRIGIEIARSVGETHAASKLQEASEQLV